MDPITAKLMSAAGAAADPVYVDDVFSTFLYDGTGSAQTITNGIDLSGEGGLVWIKSRNNSYDHRLTDTERGLGKAIESNTADAEATTAHCVNGSFNSNGFSLSSTGTPSAVNTSGDNICSWTFRKCPGFFDIVTYTGNNTAGRQIAHNLGSVPGSIWIKRTDGTDSWVVYHRSLGNNKYMFLNTGSAALTDNNINWNGTSPTSTHFTVGDNGGYANGNNLTYVAYIFAHDDQSFGDDGDEAIIKCGSYTGDGGTQNKVSVGFEPQWLLIKRTDAFGDWLLFDNMRGIGYIDAQDPKLAPNSTDSEVESQRIAPEHDGFRVASDVDEINASGSNYIYIAIDRPNKPTDTATDVFNVQTFNNNTSSVDGVGNAYVIDNIGFPPDVTITKVRNQALKQFLTTRLSTHEGALLTSGNAANENRDAKMDGQEKLILQGTYADASVSTVAWNFKRSYGFFDCLNYRGFIIPGTVSHSLGVVPELIIVKSLDNNRNWKVLAAGLLGNTKYLELNNNIGATTDIHLFDSTSPTASVFTVGSDANVNTNNENYLALLFATRPGVSKVGTYNGTGNDLDIDCGFTNGARFVMIKRTDSTSDWFVFDTARGIVSGNDPYIRLNVQNAEVTGNDYIDPLNAGFTVTSSAPTGMNSSAGTYLFLAIA